MTKTIIDMEEVVRKMVVLKVDIRVKNARRVRIRLWIAKHLMSLIGIIARIAGIELDMRLTA